MAIAKGIVAWNQKYVDEEQKQTVRKHFMNYDKTFNSRPPEEVDSKIPQSSSLKP